MWVLTPEGFFSAVAHLDNPELVVVRSRVLADSEKLAERVTQWRRTNKAGRRVKVEAYRGSDYPWRVIITKHEWTRFLAAQVDDVTYTNFKNEVTKRQGAARHDIYARVWSVLLSLEKLPGAMKGHAERAVPHPKYGAAYGNSTVDPKHDPAEQIQGEGVHSSCTSVSCRAPLTYPACHEASVSA
jgi:hypothetical protein